MPPTICFLLSTSAGHQYLPVLKEKELLTVQSPEYCRNIFKNSGRDIKVDIDSSNEVSFVFDSVVEVNAFLFEVSNTRGQRTLGELKKNCKNLTLKPQEGVFILHASDEDRVLESSTETFQFVKSAHPGGGLELKFEDKHEMFKFFLSEGGQKLQKLSFDESQIFDMEEISVKDVQLESSVRTLTESSPRALGGEKKSEDHFKLESRKSEPEKVSEIDLVVQEKDEEIKELRREVRDTKEMMERQDNQNRKLERKCFALQDQLEKIQSIASSSCHHQTQR